MRHLILTTIVLLASPVWAATPQQTLQAFHAALAGGRPAEALALLAPTVQIYESGHAERSRDEYAHHHLAADAEFAKDTQVKVLRQQERLAGNAAVVLRETETTGTFKGAPVHLFGMETAVLERQGDGWVIVHLHWSSRKRK